MHILSRNAVRAIILSGLVFLPRSAAADPVAITSGQMEVHPLSGSFSLRFEGDGFFLQAIGIPYQNTVGSECIPCVPGTSVDLGGAFIVPIASGTATIKDVQYPDVWVDGTTGTFTTPSITVGGSATMRISVPFTFSGTIVGFLENPLTRPSDVPPLFSQPVAGSGIASVTLTPTLDENPVFFASDLRYDFEAAEPVPEPASMLLCGVGAAVLAVRRRRRSRTHR